MRKITSIEDLIPQRPPFVFIDKVSEVAEDSMHCIFEVKEGGIFCEKGFLREAGIMEHIAQSAAAHIGYYSTEETRISVIGSVKDFSVFYCISGDARCTITIIRSLNETILYLGRTQ